MKEIWTAPCRAEVALDRIQIKLNKFKQYFKGWGFNIQGENRKLRASLHKELAELETLEEEAPLPLLSIQRKVEIQCNIMKLLEEEKLYWLKRSHDKWLHEGDNNTEYFHRIANGRKRCSKIVSFKDGDVTIEGTPNLLNHATDFYKTLFGPENNIPFPLTEDLWDGSELVSENDNNLLTRSFSEEEIKAALFQMEKK